LFSFPPLTDMLKLRRLDRPARSQHLNLAARSQQVRNPSPPAEEPIAQFTVRRSAFPVRERRLFSRSARAARLIGPPVPRNTPSLIMRRVWASIGAHDARLPRRRLSRGRLARLSPRADSTKDPSLARSHDSDARRFSGFLPGFPKGFRRIR